MPDTIKSVCAKVKEKLCRDQDYEAAWIVRDIQRMFDQQRYKKLNRDQVKIVKAFLDVVIKTAYK